MKAADYVLVPDIANQNRISGGTNIGGMLGGARQLTWEAYRAFPVSFRTLFVAETLASLSDLVVKGTQVYSGDWIFDRSAEPDDGKAYAAPVLDW